MKDAIREDAERERKKEIPKSSREILENRLKEILCKWHCRKEKKDVKKETPQWEGYIDIQEHKVHRKVNTAIKRNTRKLTVKFLFEKRKTEK